MEDRAQNKNRRISERGDAAFVLTYTVQRPYALRVGLGLVDAIMLNLSDSGMALITKFDLPVGAQLSLNFNLMNLNLSGEKRLKRLEITGIVVSNFGLPKGDYRIGIHFDSLLNEDKDAINNYIRNSKISFQGRG